MTAKVQVVGIGLQGAASLTPELEKLVQRATWIAGSERHVGYFFYPSQRLVLASLTQDLQQLATWVNRLAPGQYGVVLVSGDPLFFGLGRLLLHQFAAQDLAFHPHVSSVQLALNRLQLPWQDAVCLSAHGRNSDAIKRALQKRLTKLAILTDAQHHPGVIAQLCQEICPEQSYQAWVCENLGGEQEQITPYALDALSQLESQEFAPLNVLVLVQRESPRVAFELQHLPILGIPDHYFHCFADRPGMITKQAIRVQILGALALQPKQIIWDIGAGTGSVAVECARLVPSGKVYAIEKTAAGHQLIQQNCQRFQVQNLYPQALNAPQGLTSLPAPDRIFIGGSGGQLLPILNTCVKYLKLNGKIVLALATLEHFHAALTWFQAQHWPITVQQLSIHQGLSFAQLTRWQPLNPVYLIQAQPPIWTNRSLNT